jgi:hypothetical protein
MQQVKFTGRQLNPGVIDHYLVPERINAQAIYLYPFGPDFGQTFST